MDSMRNDEITNRDRLAFYRAIPIQPKERNVKEICKKARIQRAVAKTLSRAMPPDLLICESDNGELSFLTKTEKRSFLTYKNKHYGGENGDNTGRYIKSDDIKRLHKEIPSRILPAED